MALAPYPMYLSISGNRSAQEAWDFVTDTTTSEYARGIVGDGSEPFHFPHARGFVLSEPVEDPNDLYDAGHERLDALTESGDRFTRPTLAIQYPGPVGGDDAEWWFFGWIEADEEMV